ncbi:MAG TPA: HEAT repeat domain-containing protein [Vicinamibacteria bacterium]
MSAALALVLLLAPPPAVENAGTTAVRSAAAGLAAAIGQALRATAGPQWIAYAVPVEAGRQMCCGHGDEACCRGCRLERDTGFSQRGGRTARLEAGPSGTVYLRGEEGRVSRVRLFSADCSVDVGGRPLTWLTDVAPAESVRLLASYVEAREGEGRPLADAALAALAFHEDPLADRVMIAMARRDASSHVRGQALFWLAHKAGEKAASTIAQAIDDDPDADVKEKAVFALSQLPRAEGVPRLITLARTHRSREVRKKAMFWLGQSHDPRALEFIEDVLTR